MMSIATTVYTEVNSDRVRAFEYIVPIDLTSIFTGYGPLPAVTGMQDRVGNWDGTDQTRTVCFSDGSSARERLTQYDRPQYFSYTIDHFTNSLRFLVASANGEWWFQCPPTGKTYIQWRYAFTPRSVFAVPVLWLLVKVLWRGYMTKALLLSKIQLEKNIV